MPQIDKKIAAQVLDTLDSTGNEMERLAKAGLIDPKVAAELIRNIDVSADRIQIAAFGEGGLEAYKAKIAKVIKQDSDEPYMKTFENVQKPLKTDSDEPYMHDAPASFNAKAIPTFDDDISSSVSDRNEYDVRDLSEWTDKTKKQPSWPGGSSGKSTKQGSERRASGPKTWAP
jgi:hypothetical protein